MGDKTARASRISGSTQLSVVRMRATMRDKMGLIRSLVARLSRGPLGPVFRFILLPWRIFKITCFLLGVMVLVLGSATWFYVDGFLHSLPVMEKMTPKDLQAIGRKRVEEHLTNKHAFYRWVDIGDVNRGYLYSIVTSEDATFFEHDGFNYDAIMDSLAENIRERKPAFGASTISQQVVKNLFLGNEKTLVRKFKEFLITRAMERRFTKNQILEAYLNVAEFGPDIFGVEAAARHYFGKSASQINAAQGAFLALMLPSPRRNYYSIWQNRNLTRLKRRRLERVLRDMLYEEYITESQYRQFVHYRYFPGTGARMPARVHP